MKDKETYSDPQLIALLKRQDMQAYNYLFEKYAGALHGLINQILPGSEEVVEVLEESFSRISKKIKDYDPSKSRLFTWMLQITREAALEKLKVKSSRTSPVNVPGISQITHTGSFGKKLDSEQQQLIELSYLKGLSAEDVGKHLNISAELARTKIKQALLTLNTLL